MYKFIQKNQKKFLAVFAVGLMIVFILPSLPNQGGDRGRDVAFHIGDEPVTMLEGRAAADQWQTLVREIPQQLLPQVLGPVSVIARDMRESPELFLLLQKEAAQQGLRASASEVEERSKMVAQFAEIFGGRVRDPAALQQAMHGLALVQALFDRVLSGVKLSDPLVTRDMAQNAQRIKLDLAHYATEDFAKEVPPPTAEQLQKHFDAHRNTLSGNATDQNPFGFGYLVPDQATLVYLTVPRGEVAKVARKRQPDFDWKVEAMLHYRTNPTKFPVTQPAETQPTSGPTSGPTTAPAARPTTRPFEDVQEEIIDELLKPEVDRKVEEIATSLADRMKADFEARERKSAGAPEDFGTLAYLQRIKADVQKKHGVELAVSEINEPKSADRLRELKGIGQSFSTSGSESFAQYVMEWAQPFVPAARKDHASVLSVGEPSPRFRDLEGNVYVFQLRQAKPGHPPTDLAAVKDKVETDVRTKLAFDAAVTAAKKLQGAAEASGLAAAAKDAGKDVFSTPRAFDRQGSDTSFEPAPLIPAIELPPAARNKLVSAAFELFQKATSEKPHPSTVVELPGANRVVVAELADVEREWTDEQRDEYVQRSAGQLRSSLASPVLAEYFSAKAVKQRLGYRSPNEKPDETAAAE